MKKENWLFQCFLNDFLIKIWYNYIGGSMNKIANKATLILTTIIFSIIFIFSLFMQSNVFYNQNHLMSLLLTVPIFIIFYNLIKLRNVERFKNLSIKKTILFLIIYYLVISIIQFIVFKYLSVEPGWDFGVIYDNAVKYINEGTIKNSVYPEYFQYYPNNIMLFVIEIIFIKVGNLFGIKSLFSCYIMNIVFIDFAMLLLFLVLRKKYDNITGIIGLLISLFFIPLFLYVPIFYSDTMSLFVPLLIMLLYLYVDDNKSKTNYIIFICLGFVLFLGWQIKISSIFILIAILVDYILNHKKIFINLLLMIIVFGISTILFKLLIVNNERFEFQQNEYGSYPFTHWIMMGVEVIEDGKSDRNAYGGYSGEDYDLSRSFATGKDAIKFNLKEYTRRVKKLGLIGYSEFLIRKGVNVWTDGYYFSDAKISINPKNNDNLIRNFIFNNENSKFLMINFTQAVQYVFILTLIIGSVIKIFQKDNKFDYLRLTIIGLFIFFLFWEARSRYIFNYIPIFILIIIEGMMIFNDKRINKKI